MEGPVGVRLRPQELLELVAMNRLPGSGNEITTELDAGSTASEREGKVAAIDGE
jgi:hypothetical protein